MSLSSTYKMGPKVCVFVILERELGLYERKKVKIQLNPDKFMEKIELANK